MKIKNAQISLIVLFALVLSSLSFYTYAEEKSITTDNVFLDSDQDGLADSEEATYGTNPNNPDTDGDGYSDGAEVKSGYDPKKASPGDKLFPEENDLPKNEAIDPSKKNLTQEVTQKVIEVMETAKAENKEISTNQIKSIITDSFSQKVPIEEELPAIDPKEIKIKKQNYANLSEEKQFEKKKNDMSDYIAGLSYVFISNSPEPINSNDDFNNLNSSVMTKITNALSSQDPSSIKDLTASLGKMTSQMQDIEVPEEIAEDHLKGLQLIKYASNMESAINPTPNDPLTDLANYSKLQNLTVIMSDFSNTITSKIKKYDLKLDNSLQGKLGDYGVTVPTNFLEEIK